MKLSDCTIGKVVLMVDSMELEESGKTIPLRSSENENGYLYIGHVVGFDAVPLRSGDSRDKNFVKVKWCDGDEQSCELSTLLDAKEFGY